MNRSPEQTLAAEALVKRYHRRSVVDRASFEVRSGEIVGLLGPNGAGKTTSFYMVVGLVRPDAGRVVLDGNELTRAPVYRRARMGIGYLPQERSIFRRLRVEDNLRLVLQTQGLSRSEQETRVRRLIEEFHIAHLARQPAYQLSGGEQRRVEVARAMATSPSFVLLDEPFSGVDPITVHEIQEVIQGLRERGIGVLLTDHNVRDTLQIVDRAYVISDGRIVAAGRPDEVAADPLARKFYLGDWYVHEAKSR